MRNCSPVLLRACCSHFLSEPPIRCRLPLPHPNGLSLKPSMPTRMRGLCCLERVARAKPKFPWMLDDRSLPEKLDWNKTYVSG